MAIIHYSEQWDLVGNWFATNAFAVCIAALVYFLATRLDVLENKRLDEPAPFDSPQSMPECFGNIKELFSEASSGANFWSIKVMDPDQGRITAFLKYSEIHGGGLSPMLQLNRMMVADITLTPVAESEQALIPAYEMNNGQAVIGLTKLQLLWRVDSPLNRVQANEIQSFMTGSLKEPLDSNGRISQSHVHFLCHQTGY